MKQRCKRYVFLFRMVELRELPHSSDFNGLTHIRARLELAVFRGFPDAVSNPAGDAPQ